MDEQKRVKKPGNLWQLLRLERRIGVDYNLANDLYRIPLVDLGYIPTSGHICLSVKIKKGSVK